jgi:hypothetical protein
MRLYKSKERQIKVVLQKQVPEAVRAASGEMNTIHGEMKMLSTNIAQTIDQVQSQTVYEYALTVVNSDDRDTQILTAAFTFIPSVTDFQQWLSGWISCGYFLSSTPQLINVV